MSRQGRTPWWQQWWLLAGWVVVGLVLVILQISAQAWLALVSTVSAMIAVVVLWGGLRRQRREGSSERSPRD